MGTQNQISTPVPAEVVQSVTAKLQECRQALAPYLQALTSDQKANLFKMGDKSLATVEKVREYLVSNPEFKPNYMDEGEFTADVDIASALAPLQKTAEQLNSDLRDTVMLAGSEAITNALLYYGSVKEASKRGVLSAIPVYDDLSKRFTRKGGGFGVNKQKE